MASRFEIGIPHSSESSVVESLRRRVNMLEQRNHQMRSKVDAASTSDENRKHWANSDSLGPNSALDPATRAKCRNRGRYEALNNGYARGLVRTLAHDLIGTGPRLQLSIPASGGAENDEAATLIEKRFGKWGAAAKLGWKYRLLEKCAARDGGGIAILDTNERLKNPVQLDLRLVEDEQCCTPFDKLNNPFVVDGIRFDRFWQPIEYYFLQYHPGENTASSAGLRMSYVTVPAEFVLHWYECDRVGQIRGIPKITAALPIFAQLRRLNLATLTAMEVAAMLAGILKTTNPQTDGEIVEVPEWDLIELVRGTLLTLPENWDAKQFKPEQPHTGHAEFKHENLNEAGRCVGAPLNVVSGNSSGYNFSSGRLDHLPYHRGLKVDRAEFRMTVLDPVLLAWHEEDRLVAPEIYGSLPPIEEWSWSWQYDGFDEIDQNKDAQADDMRMGNGSATYSKVSSSEGDDWQENLNQLAKEIAAFRAKGLMHPYEIKMAAAMPPEPAAPPSAGDDRDEEDADEERRPAARKPRPRLTKAEVDKFRADHERRRMNGHAENGRAK